MLFTISTDSTSITLSGFIKVKGVFDPEGSIRLDSTLRFCKPSNNEVLCSIVNPPPTLPTIKNSSFSIIIPNNNSFKRLKLSEYPNEYPKTTKSKVSLGLILKIGPLNPLTINPS